jgi:hypothetical protein
MIRRTVNETPPPPPPLLREAYDDTGIRKNQMIRFQHAISYLPSHAANIAQVVQHGKWLKRTFQLLLLRNHLPMDVLQYLYEYSYDWLDAYCVPRLPPRIFSRTIHYLIRSERVANIPLALEIGKQFDIRTHVDFTTHYPHTIREFREALWPCMTPSNWSQLLGNATPEIWYLQGTYATWWLWWIKN